MEIRVNSIIESLEEFIENKNGIPLMGNVLINKNELLEYIKDIRNELPSSLTQASAIYQDREKILTDASARADNSIEQAKIRSEEIISEAKAKEASMLDSHEIVRKAKVQANEIIFAAQEEADRIIEKARLESDNMIAETFDFVEEKISRLEDTFSHAKYNAEYLRDEFNKHSASLFHILSSNIANSYEDVLTNKRIFMEYKNAYKAEGDGEERNGE